jgi:hypothetical protein
MTMDRTTIVPKKEHTQVIHKLLCERTDEIFLPFHDRKRWKPDKEQQLILDAVCAFAAQLPYGFDSPYVEEKLNEL